MTLPGTPYQGKRCGSEGIPLLINNSYPDGSNFMDVNNSLSRYIHTELQSLHPSFPVVKSPSSYPPHNITSSHHNNNPISSPALLVFLLRSKQTHINSPRNPGQIARQTPRRHRLQDCKVDNTHKRPKLPARHQQPPKLALRLLPNPVPINAMILDRVAPFEAVDQKPQTLIG